MNTTTKPEEVQIKLPSIPSELIRLAIADLEKIEKNPKYAIYMGDWHAVDSYTGKCEVCLAGSVMACTLGVSPNIDSDACEFGDDVSAKLYALNDFRTGQIGAAFWSMGIEIPDGLEDQDIVSYDSDPKEFKRQMLAMADMLESKGL
jgi:hypothetical protein